jgi:hypothetical protein
MALITNVTQGVLQTITATHATNWVWGSNEAAANQQVGITAAAWHTIAIKVVSTASIVFYGDGAQTASFDPSNAVTTGTGFGLSWNAIGVMDLDAGEVFIANSALSDANRNLGEAYLKARWGTP